MAMKTPRSAKNVRFSMLVPLALAAAGCGSSADSAAGLGGASSGSTDGSNPAGSNGTTGSTGTDATNASMPDDGVAGFDIGSAMMNAPTDGNNDCNPLQVNFEQVTPTIMLLVDRSGSMFDNFGILNRAERWDALEAALMDPTTGVVPQLQDQVRFGFSTYTTPPGYDGSDPTVCPEYAPIVPALSNSTAIQTAYTQAGMGPDRMVGTQPATGGDTPTGAAIEAATQTLAAFTEIGPKFILVVTDGNPDTCLTINPQCGADSVVSAAQAAYAQGIRTMIVGLGQSLDSDSCVGRCGADQLQDVANAGSGQPVAPNPVLATSDCVRDAGGMQGTYAGPGETPGTAPYYLATTQAELETSIAALVGSARDCTFDLSADVKPELAQDGTVLLDDTPLTYNDPNGWHLLDPHTLEVTGSACELIKNETAQGLDISFPCGVAIPR